MKDKVYINTDLKKPIIKLSDEKAGVLFKAIMNFSFNEDVQLDSEIGILYEIIKVQFEDSRLRSESARLGGLKRGENFKKKQQEKQSEKEKRIAKAVAKSKTFDERKKEFGYTLEKFKDKFSREMLTDFYRYWTEPLQKNPKYFKQEKERSWDLERRLGLWHRNDFNNKKTSENGKLKGHSTDDAVERADRVLQKFLANSESLNNTANS